MHNHEFDYTQAFSRNIGWFSPEEQQSLKTRRVAIAGCGGVGGIHTLTMARLGIGRFNLSDFDHFGVENFNRQVGATMSTLGAPKLEVIGDMLKDINPEVELTTFAGGIHEGNAEEFLSEVDLYIDSLDFFAMPPRIRLFEICARQGIPAITAAPLGMGTALLCFLPGGMSFEDYFGMAEAGSETEQFLRFYLGLAPQGLQADYLVDPTRLDLANKKGPSTILGCTLSAGVAGVNAVKVLLRRGEVPSAPFGQHWDPYINKLAVTHRPKGHRHPKFQQQLAQGKRALGLS